MGHADAVKGFVLPAGMVPKLQRLQDAGPPPVPKDAATVVLLRDNPAGGMEAHLMRRVATMAFAAGMYVFPGGTVDPADVREDLSWSGPPLPVVARLLAAGEPLARALVCAAVRETFEEAGILLAGTAPSDTDPGSVVDVTGPEWADVRRQLEAHETSLAALLTDKGLTLRADLVKPWARWITPALEPRRYDTRFFVAALPDGQQVAEATGEADRMLWLSPAEALTRHAAGELGMLPPTAFTLAELAEHDTVASVLAAADQRDLRPVIPKIIISGNEARLLLPHEAGYPEDGDRSEDGR